MTQTRKMEGKRVLVTGAGTGIGRGVALEFARQGADVALHFAHSAAGAEAAVAEIRQAGGKAEAFKADLAELGQVRALASQATEFLGGIDVLVNNAGITMNKPFGQVTPEQFDTLFNVNIRGMFFLTQSAVPGMIEQGSGAVINLTSVHAFAGMTEHTVYAGTKAAIVAFTRVLALELAPKGVRVNAIAPGWILVENHFKVLGADFNQQGGCGNGAGGRHWRAPGYRPSRRLSGIGRKPLHHRPDACDRRRPTRDYAVDWGFPRAAPGTMGTGVRAWPLSCLTDAKCTNCCGQHRTNRQCKTD